MKNKKILTVLTVFIVILLEIFLFNFRFFQGLGYKSTILSNASADDNIVSTGNSNFKFKENGGKITFDNINMEIKDIYIDMECTEKFGDDLNLDEKKRKEENKLVKVKITADDKSNSEGIVMPERSVVTSVERTKYIPLALMGETKKLVLEFDNVEDKEFKIKNIILNKGIPFHFSIVRVLAILFIIGLIYIIRPKSRYYDIKLDLSKLKQRIVLYFVIIAQIIIMIVGSHINTFYVNNTVSWQSQYNELTEALLDGQFYLKDMPEARLTALENPYDKTSREGINAKWDHAYYEGKYYVYFGIVPALLFNIPVKAILGIDIKPFASIVMLIPIFIIMSYLLVYALAKRFNKEGVSLLLYIMLSTVFVFGIGTNILMECPDMYSLPIFTAIVLGISGLYCWLGARVEGEKGYKLSNARLLIGSLLMALIAGCRPQMLLLLFLAIPLFWKEVFKDRKLFSIDGFVSTVCFAAPIVLFAGFMFYYNGSRFGSIFDFGAKYNLTTNDMTARGVSLGRVFQGIFYYLLQPLNIKGVFPYINDTTFESIYMGTTIKEKVYGGALFLVPVIWSLALIPKVKKELKEKKAFAITIMLSVFAVVIMAADSIVAGILPRYNLDFTWFLVIGAIIVIFTLYEKYRDTDFINILKTAFFIGFSITMFTAIFITVGGQYMSPAKNNPEVYWSIASLIQFWG